MALWNSGGGGGEFSHVRSFAWSFSVICLRSCKLIERRSCHHLLSFATLSQYLTPVACLMTCRPVAFVVLCFLSVIYFVFFPPSLFILHWLCLFYLILVIRFVSFLILLNKIRVKKHRGLFFLFCDLCMILVYF